MAKVIDGKLISKELKDELKEKLKSINILELTPLEALNKLNELKESIK